MEKERCARILDELTVLYPQAGPELNFSNPFETLIATILSAQCTDKRVNVVTERLFRECPDARSMVKLTQEELEDRIRECGLFHSKAKNILACCRALVDEYGGQVPREREKLEKLPGVGQKTAGVVRMAAFGESEIPVDTHVFRLSHRMGLSRATTPEKTEADLRELIEPDRRILAHHLLIWHGRRMCHAMKPDCEHCPLRNGLCPHIEPEGKQGKR